MTLFIQSHRYNIYLYLKENTELLGFSIGSEGKEFACNVGDLCSIPGSGRSSGKGNEWVPTPVFLPQEFHGQRL